MPNTYAVDVRPNFRPKDLNCMQGKGIALGSADWMCDAAAANGYPDHGNARLVFARLQAGDMPPDAAWPQPKLDAYQKWMDDGFMP